MCICGCLGNVWEGVPKAAKGNRKLRSGLKGCRHRVEGQLGGSSTVAGTGGVCPQAPGCASSCPPKFSPSQVLLEVKQLSGNPFTHTAILGNMCPRHQSYTSRSYYLPALDPCQTPLLFRYLDTGAMSPVPFSLGCPAAQPNALTGVELPTLCC